MSVRSAQHVFPILEEIGEELKIMFHAGVKINRKKDRSIVTDADLFSEKVIIDWISNNWPGDLIISEESGIVTSRESSSGWVWIVDPLDGTSNFANGLPYFCISVGFGTLQGQVFEARGGVVFDPIQGQFYHAHLGQGAFLGSQPISVSSVSELEDAYVSCGLSLDGCEESMVRTYIELSRAVQGSRRMGAAALDLANVAAGVFDVFFAANLRPWDMAAASLIIEEAGGIVNNFKDDLKFNVFEPGVVAGNKSLVDAVRKTVSKNNNDGNKYEN